MKGIIKEVSKKVLIAAGGYLLGKAVERIIDITIESVSNKDKRVPDDSECYFSIESNIPNNNKGSKKAA